MKERLSFRQRLARNTAASMAANVWTMVLALATLPIVLRGLGAEAFGVWVFLQTFSATTGWLSIPAIGLATASTRRVASTQNESDVVRGSAIGSAFAAFVVSGVGFGLALTLTAPALLQRSLDLDGAAMSLHWVGAAFGGQVVVEHISLAVTSVLEGEQRVALARLVDALRKTAVAVGVAAAATLDGSLLAVATASAAGAGLVTTLVVVVGSPIWFSIGRPTRAETTDLIRYGGTVSALSGTGVLHRTMDRTIAGIAFGPAAVALVEIANQVQAGVNALLSASTYPVLSSAPMLHGRGDMVGLRKLFVRMTRYSVLVAFPVAAIAIVLAAPLVELWVGAEFEPAVGLTQVAVLSVFLAAPLQAGSNLLLGIGSARAVLGASSATVVVNLVASLVLVQFVGLVGVFYGTLIGGTLLIPVLARPLAQALATNPRTSIVSALTAGSIPALCAAAGAGIGVLALPVPLTQLLVGAAVGILCAVVAAVRWSLPSDERREVLAALRISTRSRP